MQCLYLFNIFWDLPPRCEVWYVPISMSTTVLFADANLCNDTNIEPFDNTNIVLYSFRQLSSSERTKYTRWKIWWRHTHIVRFVVNRGKRIPMTAKRNKSKWQRSSSVSAKQKLKQLLRNDRLWIGPTKQRENAHIYFAEFFFRHIFALFFLFSVFFLWMLCVLRICTNNVCQNNS